jgi:hypothetical protein
MSEKEGTASEATLFPKKYVAAVMTATHVELTMTPNLRQHGANHRLHLTIILW